MKQSAATTYKTSGYSISLVNTRVNVTIIYPSTYKNMCIGIGGATSPFRKAADNNYWNGTGAFWNTKSYRSTKYKNIAYFRRWWY